MEVWCNALDEGSEHGLMKCVKFVQKHIAVTRSGEMGGCAHSFA